jgi:TM2 domain-containing membrane protein YozV
MALISCPECSASISDKAVACPQCGCPIAKPIAVEMPAPATTVGSGVVTVAKSRGVFIILGLLFGTLGLHNFYAGHNKRGAIKLGLVMLGLAMDRSTDFYSGYMFVAAGISGVWALIELFLDTTDGAGNVLA